MCFLLDEFADVRLLHQDVSDQDIGKIKAANPTEEETNKNRLLKINTFLIQRQTEEQRKISYWEDRWASGTSQWHKKDDINPFLSKYFEKLQVIPWRIAHDQFFEIIYLNI